MGDEYARKIAQLVVAQILEKKELDGVQKSALEVLEDLLIRYLSELGRQAHENAEISRRTVCNPVDVISALTDQAVTVQELWQFKKKNGDDGTELVQPVCSFPVPKKMKVNPTFQELKEEAPAGVPEFFPAFPDVHAYEETEQHLASKNTVIEQMQTLVEQKNAIGEALVGVEERSKSPDVGQIPDAEREEKHEETGHVGILSPYMMPPTWEEVSDSVAKACMEADVKSQNVIEEKPIGFQGKGTAGSGPQGPDELFTWTWIGGLEKENRLAMAASGKQETYEANEMALTDIRRVEELLAKNVAEEREPQILNDMDIELADEEEI